MAKYIVIQNSKGGVGKSTMAAIITRYLHELGISVALVDAGSQLNNFNMFEREKDVPFPVVPMTYSNTKTLHYYLAPLDKKYEVIVVDTNSNLPVEEHETFTDLADVVIVPLVADENDVDTTVSHLDRLRKFTKGTNTTLLGLINRYSNTLDYKNRVLDGIARDYGLEVIPVDVRERKVSIQKYRKHTSPIQPDLMELTKYVKSRL